jgi:hypothetical protein
MRFLRKSANIASSSFSACQPVLPIQTRPTELEEFPFDISFETSNALHTSERSLSTNILETTMQTMQHLIIAATLVSVLATNGRSADAGKENGWNRVMELPSGARVDVIHSGLKRSQGELVHATDSEIAIRNDAGATTIARSDVHRVSVRSRSRKHRALIGLAIGAGVGALVMVSAAHTGDIDIRRDVLAGSGAVVGAGAGAAIGAAIAGPVTVYRSVQTRPVP